MSKLSESQAQIDRINQKLGTSPEFAKKVHDYFSKPVIAISVNYNSKVRKTTFITKLKRLLGLHVG